ncbi:hypothetical protein [Streptomyces sp. NPDC020747]|uniref:hypothetical protein n=1 Tax=Streptomyces sp. NPDC020747 TaxID=3365086 RepID=UPI0037B13367
MQTPRQNKAVRTSRAGAKAAGPVAAAPQCPKPGPHGDGWPIEGKGAHAGVAGAWYCKTHGRQELVTIAEWQPKIAEQQAVEDAVAEQYGTAVSAWADADLELRRGENEDGYSVLGSGGWGFPSRRPDLGKLRRELSEARTVLDDAERELQRQRGKTAQMYQTLD